MTQRKLYVIRHVSSGAFCSSSSRRDFYLDFSYAALFMQEENAAKAVRSMKKSVYTYFRIADDGTQFGTRYTHDQSLVSDDALYDPMELEVVECTLSVN
jgi:hypothetical protein